MIQRRSHRLLTRIALAAAALILLAFVTRSWWLEKLAEPLVSAEAPVHADMIVVLGGDLRGERVLKAAMLVREGWAPAALLSGEGYIYGEHESDREVDFAVRRGYPATYFIKYPFPAQSTREEVHADVEELRRMGVHKVIVVTSNYHTARARQVFRREAPEMEVHMVSSSDAQMPVRDWWNHREARKTFLEEWVKTAAYHLGL